jgi:hypothetical protein
MFILIIIFLALVQIQFGLFVSFQVTLLVLTFLISNSLLGINPYSKDLLTVRIMSIILILFILYYNSRDIFISTAFMVPLSINRISYIDDLDIPVFIDLESQKLEILSKLTIEETNDFIKKLNDNETYLVELEFIPNIQLWDLDAPTMILCKPILINKYSSATMINKFIMNRLDFRVDYYYLDDIIIQKESNCGVSLRYCILKIQI